MFKRILMTLVVLTALPVVANAWFLTSKVITSGPSGAIHGTVINPGLKNYTSASKVVPVSAQANSGYALTQVLIDGVNQALTPGQTTFATTMTKGTANNHYFYAGFRLNATSEITVSRELLTGGNGWITADKPLTKLAVGTHVNLTFTAAPGSTLTQVTLNGFDQGPITNYDFVVGPTINTVKATFTGAVAGTENACLVCHADRNGFKAAASVLVCTDCHSANPGVNTHYNKSANDHSTKSFTCENCHSASPDLHNIANASRCGTCHDGLNPGLAAEFYSTKHWNSNLEYGAEFANQMDSTVNQRTGVVTYPGTFTNGKLNANDGYTTTENGAVVTCAYRCHFRPGFGPYSTVWNAAHTTNYLLHRKATNGLANPYNAAMTRPGGDACEACHKNPVMGHNETNPPTVPSYQDTCLVCHSGTKVNGGATNGSLVLVPNPTDVVTGHGTVPLEFFNSKHWQNNVEYDDVTMRNQLVTSVDSRGNVTNLGTFVNGQLNANDSYYTEENSKADGSGTWAVVTCAYRCHFRPGMGPNQTVGTVLKDGKSTGYISYTDTTGKYGDSGKVYRRPGGNACMACHDPHGLEASTQSTCYTCHAGGNHGWSVAAFEKSTHFTGTYAKLDGMSKESCVACHNPHSTEASFATMSTAKILDSTGLATGCQKCHTPGSPYGIFNADRTGKAPHFQTGTADGLGFYPTGSYDGGGATCIDCHYHNNTINAGWAKGGHASTTSVPLVTSSADNWNRGTKRGANISTDPVTQYGGDYTAQASVSDCQRCHTGAGFKLFYDSAFKNVSTVREGTTTSAPITCDACHVPKTAGTKLYNGAIRPLAAGVTKVKTYVGNAKHLPTGVTEQTTFMTFSGAGVSNYKNSNVCIPCHAGRGTGKLIKATFAAGSESATLARDIIRIGTDIYAHFASAAGVVNGSSAYEYNTPALANTHMKIGTGAAFGTGNATMGPCVGCHMTSTEGHSLESVTFDTDGKIAAFATPACTKCHNGVDAPVILPASVQATKENFEAALNMLRNLLLERGFDGLQAEIDARPGERVMMDMSLGYAAYVTAGGTLSKKDFAEKNTGACFNWWQFGKTVKDGKTIILGDPSAYVHNPTYTRQVIKDTMDWLDDFRMNGSITAAQIDALATHAVKTYAGVADGKPADKAKAKAYFGL